MKGKTLKYIIILATVSISGIFLLQFTFLRSSYSYSDKQFQESVTVALKEVAWQILVETGKTAIYDSIAPVEVIDNKSYLVNIGTTFDKDMLKKHLLEELKKHEVYTGFEFAIFDPVSEQMEDGILVTSDHREEKSFYVFPVNEDYQYYFSVHFPDRTSFFSAQLSIWYFSTALLLIVVIFFGYTLGVIIRQRQLSEVQKNFINNLTHELKTPISSIALSASVINDKSILDNPKRLFDYARIIQEQNNRLARNVEKVLNLASLEKNRIKLTLEGTHINDFIVETADHFRQSDPGSKAKIHLVTDKTNPLISADKFHLSNLIINILENAVKYCEKEPEIRIETKTNKKHLEVSFTDNGIGIPKEYRKKIFTKFYRVPTGNVHNVKGFGLGLDYVLKIVRAHGWKIKVNENPGGGSIFTLRIHL